MCDVLGKCGWEGCGRRMMAGGMGREGERGARRRRDVGGEAGCDVCGCECVGGGDGELVDGDVDVCCGGGGVGVIDDGVRGGLGTVGARVGDDDDDDGDWVGEEVKRKCVGEEEVLGDVVEGVDDL